MKIGAVLFDLDGTLLNTLADIARGMNTVLENAGMPSHPENAYRGMVGGGIGVLVQRAAQPGTPDYRLRELEQEWLRSSSQNPVGLTVPYEGIEDLLSYLESISLPFGILSNKADSLVHQVVERTLDRFRFAAVRGLTPGSPAKPDPTSAAECAEIMGLATTDIAYVGDSDVDMQTATAAGMLPVGAAWGYRGANELRAAGAAHVVDSAADLQHLLKSFHQEAI